MGAIQKDLEVGGGGVGFGCVCACARARAVFIVLFTGKTLAWLGRHSRGANIKNKTRWHVIV